MNDQRLRIADIRQVREELNVLDETPPASSPPLMPKPRMAPNSPLRWYFVARS